MTQSANKLRAVGLAVLVVFSMFTAVVSFSGMATANTTAVDVAGNEVSAGTQLDGSASLDQPGDNLHVVLDNGSGTYESSADSTITVDDPGTSTYWSGLDTSGFDTGTYTIYVWDDSTDSVTSGDDLSAEADRTIDVVIDGTEPTAAINSLSESTVTGGETFTVDYTATDTGGENTGVQSAELSFVNQSGTAVKDVTVSSGSAVSETVTAPTANGTYDIKLEVTDNVGNTNTVTDTDALVVDTVSPSVGLVNPEDGAELTAPPSEIVVKANDNTGVEQVGLRINNSDDEYYDGSSWVSSKSWVNASYNSDRGAWEYEVATNAELSENGTYNVVANATDTAGAVTLSTDSDTTSTAPLPPTSTDTTLDPAVEYTVDRYPPGITGATVTTPDGDGIVEANESVTVTVTASDATSGIDSVTVDATSLGKSSSLQLASQSNNQWTTSFTVDAAANGGIAVADGQHHLSVNATDAFGQSTVYNSTEFAVDTQPAEVEEMTVLPSFDPGNRFAGVVDDSEIRVTATDIYDANGNLVTRGTVDIKLADETVATGVAVENDGSVNTTIDPTQLADDTNLVGQTVDVNIVGTGATTGSVELVHEVQTVEQGWELLGTPQPAENLVAGEGEIYGYNASAQSWTADVTVDDMEPVGSAYYLNVTSDKARIGYQFNEKATDHTRQLQPGYNLVGVVTKIDESDTESELSQYIKDTSTNGDRITYHTEDTNQQLDAGEILPYTVETDGSTTLSAYGAYFVEVTQSEEEPVVLTVSSDGYDA